ncbi:hypothetical protein HHI36_024137 [Cryptolaemus montrouzieri]|uniref:Uncharacterized protein n=1 Tax=Cryptolaemus montrouzieri TaxID=559131 RepID=A0ABD2NPD4_9CUCU
MKQIIDEISFPSRCMNPSIHLGDYGMKWRPTNNHSGGSRAPKLRAISYELNEKYTQVFHTRNFKNEKIPYRRIITSDSWRVRNTHTEGIQKPYVHPEPANASAGVSHEKLQREDSIQKDHNQRLMEALQPTDDNIEQELQSPVPGQKRTCSRSLDATNDCNIEVPLTEDVSHTLMGPPEATKAQSKSRKNHKRILQMVPNYQIPIEYRSVLYTNDELNGFPGKHTWQ